MKEYVKTTEPRYIEVVGFNALPYVEDTLESLENYAITLNENLNWLSEEELDMLLFCEDKSKYLEYVRNEIILNKRCCYPIVLEDIDEDYIDIINNHLEKIWHIDDSDIEEDLPF